MIDVAPRSRGGRCLTARFAAACLVVAVLPALGGCAATSGQPPYPKDWASIRSAPTRDGCPDLEGVYRNEVAASFPPQSGEPPSLADIFRAMANSESPSGPAAWKQTWPPIPRDAVQVSIRQAPDAIVVTFIDAAGRPTPLRFRRYRPSLSEDRVDDLYGCRKLYGEPILRFFNEPHSHSSVSVLLVGGGGTFVVLFRAVDGSLIVNWRSDDVTVTRFLLGSGYEVENLWYRYARVDSGGPSGAR